MNQITSALNAFRPFIALMALVAGLIAAWGFAVELLPILGQVRKPRTATQTAAVVGAALAIIAGRA